MTGPSRRALLGAVGAGAAGVAVGAALGRPDEPAPLPTPPATGVAPVVPLAVSPFGAHQAGVTAPTPRANRLLAFDLLPGADRESLGRFMRLWSGTIAAVMAGRAAPGDTAKDLAQANVDLTVTVGWGRSLFAAVGLQDAQPVGLRPVPSFRHDRFEGSRWSGGDLLVMAAAADDTTLTHVVRRLLLDAAPFARLRWEQSGSWRGLDAGQQPATGRNLFGQVDGTGNLLPTEPEFERTLWSQEPEWFVGGTTMVVRRIRMDLDTWDELTRPEQEASVGRDLAHGAPLTGTAERDVPDFEARDEFGRFVIAKDSHLRRAHHSFNGGARILRRGFNYTDFDARTGRRDSGLVFGSFQADIEQFTTIQTSLDQSDALNAWTTALGHAEFAILPGFEADTWLGHSLLA